MIADLLAEAGANVDGIWGSGAVVPRHPSIRLHRIETPSDLLRTLEALAQSPIGPAIAVWIHAMAVLDYAPAETQSEKISSGHEELVIRLVPTPKVISHFKRLFPSASLVGFKLKTTEDPAQLKEAAISLAESNGCDLVVANPSPFQDPGRHTGYLWEPGSGVWSGPFSGKHEIAELLVGWIVRHVRGKPLPDE
jgi:phosphopantothenoylcysteine synthetase/decarboxylase